MSIFGLSGFTGLITAFVIVGVVAMAVQQPTGAVRVFQAGADTVTGLTHGMEGKS